MSSSATLRKCQVGCPKKRRGAKEERRAQLGMVYPEFRGGYSWLVQCEPSFPLSRLIRVCCPILTVKVVDNGASICPRSVWTEVTLSFIKIYFVAPWALRSASILLRCRSCAISSAVRQSSPFILTFAPFLRSNFTTSKWPSLTAIIKAV